MELPNCDHNDVLFRARPAFEQAVRAYAADLRPRARYRLVAAAAGHVLLKRLPGRAEGLPGQWTATAPAR